MTGPDGHHTLDELDRRGIVVSCDSQVANELAGSKLVRVRREADGRWRLLPNERVGVVRIGDIEVNVRPKVGIARLLFLLGYAIDPGFQPEDVSAEPAAGLWPALATSLARQVEFALTAGVLQGYRTIDASLPLVRGRIRVGDQLTRRPGTLLPLEVRYEDFTIDITENRLLKTALQRMLTVPGVTPALAARIHHLAGRLNDVTLIRPGAPLPSWRPTRMNTRYAGALRLSELVLQHLSVEPGRGDRIMAGFVVSMERVFERFVCTALTTALQPRPGRSKAHHRCTLDVATTGGPPPLIIDVDLVHLVGDQPVIALDAKYKLATGRGGYPNADHYQMLAYCTALGVPTGWLIYAHGTRPPTVRAIRNSAVRIVEFPLDLGADPRDLLKQIRRLADLAWERSPTGASSDPKAEPVEMLREPNPHLLQ